MDVDLANYKREWRKKNKDKVRISQDKYYKKNKHLVLFKDYVRRDKNKNLENDLTLEWLENNIFNKSCIYCGRKINIGYDRKDNNLGHTKDNVMPCCWDCNRIRGDMFSIDQMILIGKFLYENIY